jgi:hypothetical protein
MVEYLGGWVSQIRECMKRLHNVIVNDSQVNDLYRVYASRCAVGKQPAVFVGNLPDAATREHMIKLGNILGFPTTITRSFLFCLYTLAVSGKIPRAKLDPKGVADAEKQRLTLPSERGILERASDVAQGAFAGLKSVAFVAALGVAAVLAMKYLPKRGAR